MYAFIRTRPGTSESPRFSRSRRDGTWVTRVVFCSIMFGATTEFFFRHLLGIQQAEHSRGYKHVVFRPSVLLSPAHLAICANLSSVQGTLLPPSSSV